MFHDIQILPVLYLSDTSTCGSNNKGFHQSSVHIHLATEIIGLVCQSEASVVQSEHYLHNLHFVSVNRRLVRQKALVQANIASSRTADSFDSGCSL